MQVNFSVEQQRNSNQSKTRNAHDSLAGSSHEVYRSSLFGDSPSRPPSRLNELQSRPSRLQKVKTKAQSRTNRLPPDQYYRTVINQYMTVCLEQPFLTQQVTGLKPKPPRVKSLIVTDPHTKRPLCTISYPKVKLSKFNEAKCIDLNRYIVDDNQQPDFGFDCEPKSDTQTLQQMFSLLIGPKQKQKSLWSCIDRINGVKQNFNDLLKQKLKSLPKYLRNHSDIKSLFENAKAKNVKESEIQNTEEPEEESQQEIESPISPFLQRQETTIQESTQLKRSVLLPSKNKYHKIPFISQLLLRCSDRTLAEYSLSFYEKLQEIDGEVETIRRQLLLQNQEQKQVKEIIPQTDKDNIQQLKIKVALPFKSIETPFSLEYNKQRCSVKFLDQLGVKRFDISCQHMIDLAKMNRIQAPAKVDHGSIERLQEIKQKALERIQQISQPHPAHQMTRQRHGTLQPEITRKSLRIEDNYASKFFQTISPQTSNIINQRYQSARLNAKGVTRNYLNKMAMLKSDTTTNADALTAAVEHVLLTDNNCSEKSLNDEPTMHQQYQSQQQRMSQAEFFQLAELTEPHDILTSQLQRAGQLTSLDKRLNRSFANLKSRHWRTNRNRKAQTLFTSQDYMESYGPSKKQKVFSPQTQQTPLRNTDFVV